MGAQIRDWIVWLDTRHHRFALGVTSFLVLVLAMPPTGIPNDNEYHYFAIAAYSVDPHSVLRTGSLEMLGGAQHTAVFSKLVGHVLQVLGSPGTQVMGTMTVLALFAWALSGLFHRLELGLLDVLLVLTSFVAMGQEILGAEWLFGGFEPKAIAYPLVIVAITSVFAGRLRSAAAWLGAATYFHFLVAGLWFGLIGLWLLFQRRPVRSIVGFGLLYVLVSLPIVILVLVSYGGHLSASGIESQPSVSWIYSHFRMAHHVAPFSDRWTLLAWFPGIVLLVGVGIATGLLLLVAEGHIGTLARLVGVGVAFLLMALAVAGLDTDGVLGPLNLFRPSSLVLLLFLTVLIGAVSLRLSSRSGPLLKMIAILLVGALSVPTLLADVVEPSLAQLRSEPEKRKIAIYLTENTPPDSVFLLHPDLERNFLDFEQRVSRRALVLYKFIPTTHDGIREWYRRVMFRDAVLGGQCSADLEYRVDYFLVPVLQVGELAGRCGEVVFSTERYAVIAASATG
jgi:hypothetical protein